MFLGDLKMLGRKLVFATPAALLVLALAGSEGPAAVAAASQSSSSPFSSISARFGAWGKSAAPEAEQAPQETALTVGEGAENAARADGAVDKTGDEAQQPAEGAVEEKKKDGLFSKIKSFVPGLLFHLMCLVTYMWYSQKFYTPKAKEVKEKMQSEAPDAPEPTGAEVLAAVKKESPNTAVALESLEAMVMTSLLTVVASALGKSAEEVANKADEEMTGIASEEGQPGEGEENAEE